MNEQEKLEQTLMIIDQRLQGLSEDDPQREELMRDARTVAAELQRIRVRTDEGAPAEEEDRGSLLNPIADASLLGAGDEVAALGAATVGTLLPESMGGFPPADQPEGFARAFTDIYRDIEGDREAFAERNPVGSLATEIGVSAVPVGAAVSRATAALSGPGRSPLRRMTENVAGTAAIEAGYGAAAAPEGDRGEGAAMGALMGPIGGIFGELGNYIAKRSAARREATEGLQAGSATPPTVRYRLDDRGRLVNDTFAREALRQNLSEEMVLTVKAGTPEDREAMLEMLQLLRQRDAGNPRARIFLRPSDVAGRNLMKRVDDLMEVRKDAAERLDEVAESTLAGRPADVTDIEDGFYMRLRRMGVGVDENGALDFTGEASMGGTNELTGAKGFQRTMRSVATILENNGQPVDGLALHRMKRALDSLISQSKAKGNIGGRVANVIEDTRAQLMEAARAADPSGQYAAINDQFSKATSALDAVSNHLPTRVDLDSERAAEAFGDAMRRLTSNYASRNDLIMSMGALEDTARDFGFEYGDDIVTQAAFLRDLEDTFGAMAETSLTADVARATMGRDSPDSARGKVLEVARSNIGRLVGIDKENALRAAEELIRSYQ